MIENQLHVVLYVCGLRIKIQDLDRVLEKVLAPIPIQTRVCPMICAKGLLDVFKHLVGRSQSEMFPFREERVGCRLLDHVLFVNFMYEKCHFLDHV